MGWAPAAALYLIAGLAVVWTAGRLGFHFAPLRLVALGHDRKSKDTRTPMVAAEYRATLRLAFWLPLLTVATVGWVVGSVAGHGVRRSWAASDARASEREAAD